MKFRDVTDSVKDWWDDATEETKTFVMAAGLFAAGLVVGAWAL